MHHDMTGQQFGRLTVEHRVFEGTKNSRWQCRCICGSVTTIYRSALINGLTQSCGCLRREVNAARIKTHGMAESLEHLLWQAIRRWCGQPSDPAWKNYGGRGILVCDRWNRSFVSFMADMGARPEGATLDRFDGNGHYEPGNCRWATYEQQARSRRSTVWVTYLGLTMSLAEACSLTGVKLGTAVSRRHRGWPQERWLQ